MAGYPEYLMNGVYIFIHSVVGKSISLRLLFERTRLGVDPEPLRPVYSCG